MLRAATGGPRPSEPPARSAVEAAWSAPGAGRRYRGERWRSLRAAQRDPGMVLGLLNRHLGSLDGVRVLDAPCGTGRLRPALASRGARYVGVDLSAEMLRAGPAGAVARADVGRLPFADRAFDVVVCCRLLHHLAAAAERNNLLGELVRVSRGLVLVSYWDAASWQAWRRARGWRRAARPDQRVPIRRGELERSLVASGAEVLGYRHSLRFVSCQAFVAARRRP